jgi:alkanesulfonate monooxygenase SsuD/methylene tetrahydromethanopterin reductase-like flavin-dependent oxidoreductase (luciferase family)
LRFAEDVATIQHVTKGKVIVGVAVGYRNIDFQNFGINLNERAGRMDEALKIVRDLLSGLDVTFDGRYYRLCGARLHPRPYAGIRPQMWLGGWKSPAIRRAAQLGDRWFPGPVADINTVRKCLEIYKEELTKAGKKFDGITIMRDVYLSKTREAALEESKNAFLHMYQDDYSKSRHPILNKGGKSLEEWASGRFIVGDANDAIEAVDELRKLGADYVILRTSLRGVSHDQMMNSIKIFGEKVLPNFSD